MGYFGRRPSPAPLSFDDVSDGGSIVIDNAGTIGSVGDSDAVSVSSGGVLNFTQEPTVTGEDIYYQGNILGTVSQSGGTPTGAVIERGSNANGEYVKFADGTMLCFMSGQQVGTAGGTATITVQYPASFTISSNNRRVATREIKTLIDFGTQAYDSTADGASAVGSSIPKVATRNTSSPFGDQVVVAIEGLQTNTGRYQDYAILAVGRWF